MDVINEFVFQAAASPWLLLVMFAVAVVDGFFPPIPSETVLVAAAAAAASAGAIPTVLVLCLIAAVGATIGDNIAYAIGRGIGTSRFHWMRGPRVSAALGRAQASLEQRGAPFILGARFIPVGRVAVNMSAGALGYSWRRFLPLSAIAAVSWSVYSVLIGVVAGQWLTDQPLLSAVIGVVVAVVIGIVIDMVGAARRRRTETTSSGNTQKTQLAHVSLERDMVEQCA
ncbi:DedA family protein [Paramicrobacterium chengjingii]|uniref:DedA family protein n=1 Tax=Paramicrobacterium chengjingii TaxID=2769067 RepID=A0ABX6YFM9_9MICO|nr:DedA family protein [Microbacterium chengjingii]QPZ37598.1 DedA family protein [Microbacterium chengjingii]